MSIPGIYGYSIGQNGSLYLGNILESASFQKTQITNLSTW